MSVRVGDSPEATSQPVILFEGRYAFGAGITIPNYDVASDGNRFLMVKDFSASLGNVRVVLNWFAELDRLAPTEK